MKRYISVVLFIILLLTGCNNLKSEDYSSLDNKKPEFNSNQQITTKPSQSYTTTTKTTTTEKITSTPIETTVTTTTTAPRTVLVTIPEGYSFAQIAELMEDKGVCSVDSLLATVNTYDFSYYSLIGDIDFNSTICFKLEGYLCPNTYEFYLNEKPENVLGKLLRHNELRITESQKQKAISMGYSIDEIITIASIIEKEVGNPEEMKNVSSVIHNRLKAGMKLQVDSSIYYVERYIKPYITGDINRYNSFYNTNKCPSLPAGPICNPSNTAINAALNPNSTEYLFFASDSNEKYYYAITYEEHLNNLKLHNIT